MSKRGYFSSVLTLVASLEAPTAARGPLASRLDRAITLRTVHGHNRYLSTETTIRLRVRRH